MAFLISDFCLPNNFDQDLKELQPKLQISNRRHDLIAMIVSDPREFDLPDVGWITLEDAENGEQIDLNTSDTSVRKRYSEIARTRQKMVQKSLRSAGIDLLDLFTDTSYLPALLSFFSARKGRLS